MAKLSGLVVRDGLYIMQREISALETNAHSIDGSTQQAGHGVGFEWVLYVDRVERLRGLAASSGT